MNEEDFIIISSDEETEINSISKKTEASRIDKKNEKTVKSNTNSVKSQFSIYTSDKQKATAHSSKVDEKNISSSQNTNFDISIKAQDSGNDNEELKKPKKCMQTDPTETEIDTTLNVKEVDRNYVQMSNTFENFLQLVLSMEKEEDDRQKLNKKIMKYHNLADPNYVKSDEFNNMLKNGMTKLTKKQSLLYPIIKEILDCLLSQRITSQKIKPSSAEEGLSGENVEKETADSDSIYFDNKNYKIVKKLTKALRKLEKKIKELEEAEVDLSDEEDSTYFRMQRYRERFCQVYKKLCTYTNQTANAKRICTRKISFNGSNNLQLDRAIESWLNKTSQFPDFASVLKFITDSNENLQLEYSKEHLKNMAIDIFTKIGKSLQLRRKYDLWESFNSFLDNEIDPSVNDPELRERLNSNFEIASKKESQILKYYADLQTKNSLEPIEVPDEEANCSPVESGDEDENEIEEVENMLNSRISEDVEDNEEEDEDEKDNHEENGQENINLSSTVSEEEIENANSANADGSSKSEHGSGSTGTENTTRDDKSNFKNPNNSKNNYLGKELNCNDVENCKEKASGSKRSPDIEITHCVKKPKLSKDEVHDNDSDCEVVIVLSDEETNFKSTEKRVLKQRKVHQVNYSFINNSFNHNVLLTLHDALYKRKSTYSCFKSRKDKRKILPLSDLTDIKRITNKYVRTKGGMEKKNGKIQETFKRYRKEKFRLWYSKFIYPDKMSNHCSLKNKSGSENLKSKNGSNQTNKESSCEKTSNENSLTSSNNGASGGDNGEDNNKDNGDKNSSNEKMQIDENEEIEDEDDDEDDDKETLKTYENNTTGDNGIVERNGNENNDILLSDDLLISPQQLVCVTIDIPHPTSKYSNLKRNTPNKSTTVSKNTGLPSTSKTDSRNSSFNSKPRFECLKSPLSKYRKSSLPNLAEFERVYSQRMKQSTSTKTSKSDEEIVNNFLLHSPSSISIKSPKNLLTKNKPSPSILQALQTLSRLKSITTTVVKGSGKKEEEDVTVIGESLNSNRKNNSSTQKYSGIRNESFVLPKIVTVQGNVSGFENINTDNAVSNNSPDKSTGRCRRKTPRSQSHLSNNRRTKSDNTKRTNNQTRQQRPKKNNPIKRRSPKKKSEVSKESTKDIECVVLD